MKRRKTNQDNAPRAAVDGVDRLLKLPEVIGIAGIGKTMIYRLVRAGSFPGFIKLGASTLWSEREVQAWVDRMVAERRAA
jgi:prophage regulatory protein